LHRNDGVILFCFIDVFWRIKIAYISNKWPMFIYEIAPLMREAHTD